MYSVGPQTMSQNFSSTTSPPPEPEFDDCPAFDVFDVEPEEPESPEPDEQETSTIIATRRPKEIFHMFFICNSPCFHGSDGQDGHNRSRS